MKFSPRSITLTRRCLLGVAGWATLVALFVTIENVRGDRAWQATEAMLKSRGAPRNLEELHRLPAAALGRNFFETPLVGTLLRPSKSNAATRTKLLQDTKVAKLGLSLVGGKGRDLARLRQQLENLKLLAGPPSDDPAADIRAALKPADAVLDELQRAALEYPESQLPLHLPTEETPESIHDFPTLSQIGGALLLRATADTVLGRSETALADIVTVFRMADGLSRPPSNLGQFMLAQRWRALAAIPLREGLRRHIWKETQLTRMQALWADYSSIARLRAAWETEQVWTIAYIDGMRDREANKYRPWWLFHGWIQQSKAAYVDFMEQKLFPVLDASGDRILSERLAEADRSMLVHQDSHLPYLWFVRQMGGSFYWLISRTGEAENVMRLAATAIALERHRLVHGVYPLSLTHLAPALLPAVPVDVFTGKPLNYVLKPQGGFALKVNTGPDSEPNTSWDQTN